MLMRLGRVLAVHDHSVPDYDFQRIYDENKDNIIGMYIQHISEMEISDDLKAKALCYGMKAFIRRSRRQGIDYKTIESGPFWQISRQGD